MSKTILVVEDDLEFRDVVVTTLKRAGYTVHEAENGAAAMKLIESMTIDIVLSDIRMPVMDGMDLLKHVQELEKKPKVVMMTGFSTTTKEEVISAGAETLVEKTDLVKSLLSLIASIRLY